MADEDDLIEELGVTATALGSFKWALRMTRRLVTDVHGILLLALTGVAGLAVTAIIHPAPSIRINGHMVPLAVPVQESIAVYGIGTVSGIGMGFLLLILWCVTLAPSQQRDALRSLMAKRNDEVKALQERLTELSSQVVQLTSERDKAREQRTQEISKRVDAEAASRRLLEQQLTPVTTSTATSVALTGFLPPEGIQSSASQGEQGPSESTEAPAPETPEEGQVEP